MKTTKNASSAKAPVASTLAAAAPAAPAPPASGIDLASIQSSVAAILAALGGTKAMTIADRRRLAKLRPGGEPHVETVMSAAERCGLVLPGVDRAAVAADLALLRSLGPVVERVAAASGLIEDLVLQAESRVWRATTRTYKALCHGVIEVPTLQRELEPVASFFAVRFKNAPTAVRPQERRALANARRARKRKADQEAAGSPPTKTAPPTPPPASEAPKEAAPPADVAHAAPPAPAPAETSPGVGAVIG